MPARSTPDADTTAVFALADPDARARWDALAAESAQSSPFSSLAYADALTRVSPLSASLCLLSRRSRDACGLLIFHRRLGPFRSVVVPPLTPYTPPLFRRLPHESRIHDRTSTFEALLNDLESRYDRIHLHLHPSHSDVRPALWRGWRAHPLFTYVSDLDEEDDVLRTWSGGTRRLFQNEADAFVYREAPDAAETVTALVADGYARHGRTAPLPEPQLGTLIRLLADQGLARILTVTRIKTETVEGGLVLLQDPPHAYYWLAGSRPGPAMTVLLGHLLPQLRDQGFRDIDFVGANTPSIAEFKRHFGGRLVPYFRLESDPNPAFRLLNRLLRR